MTPSDTDTDTDTDTGPGVASPGRARDGGDSSRGGAWSSAALAAAVVLALAAVVWVLWPASPGPAVLHTGTGHEVVTVTVDSPRRGSTPVDIELADRAGRPIDTAVVRVEAVMPLMGHATPPVTAVALSAGRYRADGVDLMMTGPWQLALTVFGPDPAAPERLTVPLQVSG